MKDAVKITPKQIAILADVMGDIAYAINADRLGLTKEEVSAIRMDALRALVAAQDLVYELRCELGPWEEVDPVLKPMFAELEYAKTGVRLDGC